MTESPKSPNLPQLSAARRLLESLLQSRPQTDVRRGRLLLERLEGRQLLAGDVDLFATDGAPPEDQASDAAAQAQQQLDASGLVAEGEAAPDLVAFAKALKDAGVTFYGAAWCPFCTEQKELFEDGQRELPFVEVTGPDQQLNSIGVAEGIETFPTWEFPDSTRATGVLTLQQLSQRSGVAIPQSESPGFFAIGPQTVRIGSPLHVPVDAYDPNGGPLTVTVTVANPNLLEAVVLQGNRSLRMDMKGYGDMVFELFEDRAPRPTGRVIQLAQQGFYDDIIFHRVIDGFMIQGGDPLGTGSGGSEMGDFDDQFHPDLQHNRGGILSFAKSSDDTNDSQFFITETATRHLDFNHSIFGQLVEGDDVREAISGTKTVAPGTNDKPVEDVVIESFSVFNDTENAVVMLKALGNQTGTTNVTFTVTDADGNSHSEVVAVTIANDNSNSPPFLQPVDSVVSAKGTPATFTLSSVDVEGDAVKYVAAVADGSGATVNVNATSGSVTVTPPANYSGTVNLQVGVEPVSGVAGQIDTQRMTVTFAAGAPTSLDLAASSDSGVSNTDNVTKEGTLTFVVGGLTNGAHVELLVGDTPVGVGTASGTTATITTANIAALGNGTYSVTARQRVGGVTSPASSPLTVVYDTQRPAQLMASLPTLATVGTAYAANLSHSEEGSGLRYSLSNSPAGATIDAETGLISWTPTASQLGSQTLNVNLTDPAGNLRSQTFTVNVGEEALVQALLTVTDLDGNAITSINTGEEFLLNFHARDMRGLDAEGVFAAFVDVLFDGDLVEPVAGAEIDYNSGYGTIESGTVGDGLIDELGAVSSSTSPTGTAQVRIASVRMRALQSGQVTFNTEPADGSGSDFLLFGEDETIPDSGVGFGSVSLAIDASFAAVNDSFTVNEDSNNNSLTVLANDTTANASVTLTLVSVGTPSAGGQATVSGNAVRYTPPADYSGTDQFTYVVRDQTGAEQTATVTVTVVPVNDPPTAVADTYNVTKGSAQRRLEVLANDTDLPDAGETLTISAIGTTSNGGTVAISSDGKAVLYKPAATFTGQETFTYTVSDGTSTSQATVTVTVAAAVPGPNVASDAFTVTEDAQNASFDVLANDTPRDPQKTIALQSVQTTGSAGGTASVSNGKVVYRPKANFFGTETVTYTVAESGGGTTTGTITFTVTPSNDPPPAGAIAKSIVKGTQNQAVVTLSALGTNVDGNETVTITAVGSTSAGGTVQIGSNGTVVNYSPPNATFVGTDTFTYTVKDAAGATATGTATVTVLAFQPRDFALEFSFLTAASGRFVAPPLVLRGTTETGESVEVTQSLDATGKVLFADQAPGEYTIEIPAMPFLIGGEQSQTLSVDSDPEDGDVLDLQANVGSLRPEFITIKDFLGSTPPQAVLAAVQPGQSGNWVLPSGAITGLTEPRVSLSQDGKQVQIRAKDAAGTMKQATIPATGDSRVELRGTSGNYRLLRVNLDPKKVTYTNAPAGSSTAAASTTNDSSQSEDGSSQAEGEAPASQTAAPQGTATPLVTSGVAEGEQVQVPAGGNGTVDFAAVAQQRQQALDAAFAAVADPANRPAGAERILASGGNDSVEAEAVDALLSTLGDDAR